MRNLLACLAGVAAFVAAFFADVLAVQLIGKCTDSALMGICGPYGSETAIGIMWLIFIVGFFASCWAACVAARAVVKSRP